MEKIVRIVKRNEPNDDVSYWRTQPYEKRLEALEDIRKEYNDWKYGTKREFQRVYKIIKRSSG